MKSSNRIHKNGATKPAKVQAKINEGVVNLIVSDPATGKQFVNRNIPKAIFAKVLAVGKKEQIGVGGLIELNLRQLVQESNSPHENIDIIKARRAAEDMSQASLKAKVALEADDALSIMEATGRAAIALAMLNADRIKKSALNDDGWQSLDVCGFSEGVVDLAGFVCSDFRQLFSHLASQLRPIIKSIREINQPLAPVSTTHNLQPASIAGGWLWEEAVGSLRHCIEMQGLVLSERSNHQIAHNTSFAMAKKLDEAFNVLCDAQGKLGLAFNAIKAASHTADLRRAA